MPNRFQALNAALLLSAMAISCAPLSTALAQGDENIPRILLIGMAQEQYEVLCGSEVFKQCMGFSGTACSDLASVAIEQCLMPLPLEISPEALDNSALESCPKLVFENAGFSEEKAGQCFDEAMEAEGS